MPKLYRCLLLTAILLAMISASTDMASAQQKKPNILVIFGDDIGMWNVAAPTE